MFLRAVFGTGVLLCTMIDVYANKRDPTLTDFSGEINPNLKTKLKT
jgi:hypothetical protein